MTSTSLDFWNTSVLSKDRGSHAVYQHLLLKLVSLQAAGGSSCWNTKDREGMVLPQKKHPCSWSHQIPGLVHQSSVFRWIELKLKDEGKDLPQRPPPPKTQKSIVSPLVSWLSLPNPHPSASAIHYSASTVTLSPALNWLFLPGLGRAVSSPTGM